MEKGISITMLACIVQGKIGEYFYVGVENERCVETICVSVCMRVCVEH